MQVDSSGALDALVRVHLRAYGPATRRDIAWWSGHGLTRVDAAVARLGDGIVSRLGSDGSSSLDVADPPRGGWADPGVRLLPEFDGLVVGYHPKARARFLDDAHADWIWNRSNGVFSSTVLYDGGLVRWRLIGSGRRRTIEVDALPGESTPSEEAFVGPVDGLAAAMDVQIGDLRIRTDR